MSSPTLEPIFQQAEQSLPHCNLAAVWMKPTARTKVRATESIFTMVL